MIFELQNFVTQEQLDFINLKIADVYDNPNFSKRKINSYRDGKTIKISETKELKELDDYLFKIFSSDELIGFIKRRYFPAFDTADTGYEFHRYPPGECCHVHADGEVLIGNTPGEESLLRFASIVLHLNTPRSGGELVFPTLNKTIKTEAGKLVIFPPYGFAQHYTQASQDSRDVIVAWFVYKDLLVRRV